MEWLKLGKITLVSITYFLTLILALALSLPPRYIIVEAKEEPPKIPPILAKIAYCESGDRHWLEDGSVIMNQKTLDVGRYQINLPIHGSTADKMGIDLFTEEGNLAYALRLYELEGTQPWSASKKCWQNL